MKKTKHGIAIVLLATLGIPFMDACAQGSLTPPGAPAPTMKTLDQLEPRTPISTTTTITQSGSYYLTTNIVVSSGNGITIYADEVTLDLNGFTIRSTAASATGYGIYLYGFLRDIAIANGFIVGGVTNNGSGVFSGPGFVSGIYVTSNPKTTYPNLKVSGISVAGCAYYGIRLSSDDTTVVTDCTVRTVGGYGILAGTVKSSLAADCGATAILAGQVSSCCGKSVGGFGIDADTVHNSYGHSDRSSGSAYGITASTVENSYGYGSSETGYAYGINADTVHNSYGYGFSIGRAVTCGISGRNVGNSYGYASSSESYAYGINATTVENSYGHGQGSSKTFGINATTVENSYGEGNGYGSDSAYGIYASAAETSYGYCFGGSGIAGYGIYTYAAVNCRGHSTMNHFSSRGIFAEGPVDTCYANCSYGTALEAESASNCRGESTDGYGINVVRSAINCVGISGSNTGLAGSMIQNCYGFTSSGSCGLWASTAQNCYGNTSSGDYGLYAYAAGIGCRGNNGGSGIGIYGRILNSCYGTSSAGTAVSALYKYNMP